MSAVRKHVLMALVLTLVPALSSLTLQGTFVTAIVALPGCVILTARLFESLWRLVRPAQARSQHLQAAVLFAFSLLLISVSVVHADSDLRALTQQRLSFLKSAAPAFQRYLAENGRWPERPEMLVPAYLPQWPDYLRIEPPLAGAMRVRYEQGHDKQPSQVIFFALRGPDATVRFNLADGSITRDR